MRVQGEGVLAAINAIKKGRARCQSGSLPALEIEKAVVEQIRCVGQDQSVLEETLSASRAQADAAIEQLDADPSASFSSVDE